MPSASKAAAVCHSDDVDSYAANDPHVSLGHFSNMGEVWHRKGNFGWVGGGMHNDDPRPSFSDPISSKGRTIY